MANGKVPDTRHRFNQKKQTLKNRLQQLFDEYDEDVVRAALLDMLPDLLTETLEAEYEATTEYINQYLPEADDGGGS